MLALLSYLLLALDGALAVERDLNEGSRQLKERACAASCQDLCLDRASHLEVLPLYHFWRPLARVFDSKGDIPKSLCTIAGLRFIGRQVDGDWLVQCDTVSGHVLWPLARPGHRCTKRVEVR